MWLQFAGKPLRGSSVERPSRFVELPLFGSLKIEAYQTNEGRRAGKDALHKQIAHITQQHTRDHLAAILLSGGFPNSPITPIEGVKVTIDWPDLGVEGAGGPVMLVTSSTGRYSYEYGSMFDYDRVTIIPSHPAYEFSPSEYDLVPTGGDRLDLDFTASPVGAGSRVERDG